VASPASVVLLVLSTGAILLGGDRAPSNILGFSYDAPAVGLKATCALSQWEFGVGHRIWVDFTITNNTIEVKPICWSPSERNFFRRKGPTLRELEGTGISCVAYPIIREPILIKSAKEERLQYVLYLPPVQDASSAYNTIIQKFPESPWADAARESLGAIRAKPVR
jgi:hypothetical protein